MKSGMYGRPTSCEAGSSRSPTGSESTYARTSRRMDVSNCQADVSSFNTLRSSGGGGRRSSDGQARLSIRNRRTSSSTSKEGVGKSSVHTLPDGFLDEQVKVYVRVRPMAFQSGVGDEEGVAIRVDSEKNQVTLFDEKDVQAGRATMQRSFEFDGVFPPNSSQEDLFEVVGKPVLHGVLAGYDGTILAYGQTGSGKTHSLLNLGEGGPEHAGLVSRLGGELFKRIAKDRKHMYSVELACCQIYNEAVLLMLCPAVDCSSVTTTPVLAYATSSGFPQL